MWGGFSMLEDMRSRAHRWGGMVSSGSVGGFMSLLFVFIVKRVGSWRVKLYQHPCKQMQCSKTLLSLPSCFSLGTLLSDFNTSFSLLLALSFTWKALRAYWELLYPQRQSDPHLFAWKAALSSLDFNLQFSFWPFKIQHREMWRNKKKEVTSSMVLPEIFWHRIIES